MNPNKAIAVLEEMGKYAIKMIAVASREEQSTGRNFLPALSEIHEKCLSANLSMCLFKKVSTTQRGQPTLSVTAPLLNGWPTEDSTTTHAHVTICFHLTSDGAEAKPNDICIEFVNLPASGIMETLMHQPEKPQQIKRPSEGSLISKEETERLLKAFGINPV